MGKIMCFKTGAVLADLPVTPSTPKGPLEPVALVLAIPPVESLQTSNAQDLIRSIEMVSALMLGRSKVS